MRTIRQALHRGYWTVAQNLWKKGAKLPDDPLEDAVIAFQKCHRDDEDNWWNDCGSVSRTKTLEIALGMQMTKLDANGETFSDYIGRRQHILRYLCYSGTSSQILMVLALLVDLRRDEMMNETGWIEAPTEEGECHSMTPFDLIVQRSDAAAVMLDLFYARPELKWCKGCLHGVIERGVNVVEALDANPQAARAAAKAGCKRAKIYMRRRREPIVRLQKLIARGRASLAGNALAQEVPEAATAIARGPWENGSNWVCWQNVVSFL